MAKYLPLFSGGDDLVAPEIPLDLQTEILKRLPAKSLMRFKCVSNLWSFLIRSRYFSKLYRPAASPPRQPCIYMSLLENEDNDSMEACQNPGKTLLLALSSSSTSDGAESWEPFLTMEGMGGYGMVILGGLILYNVCRKAIIYNPTTRQSVTLPAIFALGESHDKSVSYFLGHDPVLDQYKVVCKLETFPVQESDSSDNLDHWVFVLEPGGCWKKIEFDQPAHVATSMGLCINGVLYYLACTRKSREFVMSFDVRSEEFKMIHGPQLGEESVAFIEYDGKPAIFDHTCILENGLVDLWVMEDGGLGKWSKKSRVLQPCQMHLLKDDSTEEVTVPFATQKGEIILVPSPLRYLLYYDIQKNDVRKKATVNGLSALSAYKGFHISFGHMDQHETIMHLEI